MTLRIEQLLANAQATDAHVSTPRFLFRQFARHAATISVVLICLEIWVPLADSFHSPERRVFFLLWWSAAMAGWQWVRRRLGARLAV